VNVASGRPGRGTAIVSCSKYQSACRSEAQSLQVPLASRNDGAS